jgi:hypothetical protein
LISDYLCRNLIVKYLAHPFNRKYMSHTFHIPVLGLAYSIDTPLKVARYGISSVVSIVDDELIERMRELHTPEQGNYIPILKTEPHFRPKRITAYLDLIDEQVDAQHKELISQPFTPGTDITRYFELLPSHSGAGQLYKKMLKENDDTKKSQLQSILRTFITKGSIDVNIMSKVDKINQHKNLPEDEQLSDALAALKGFADSRLNSSLIVSAGMNPKLYSYMEEFADFYPRQGKAPRKKIILKVSDYRSAFIQARFLAKKGLWIHEFRIESGFLLGPILEEFKQKREEMINELFEIYMRALEAKGLSYTTEPAIRITVQGGIGTAGEDEFLRQYYQLDGTGWGSPFLLVPEVTNVDEETLQEMVKATEEDFYISGASPLGVPFNNFRKSSAEALRLKRIDQGRPGSPCTKKYLVSNTEFTAEPICTASREYQHLKIKELKTKALSEEEYNEQFWNITEKVCLCQGLSTAVYLKNDILKARENKAVTICPGPNTAFFSGPYTLEEMVKHIYGAINLLEGIKRPNLFVNELKLYIGYLKKDIETNLRILSDKKVKQLEKFRDELLKGVHYYMDLIPKVPLAGKLTGAPQLTDLQELKQAIGQISLPDPLPSPIITS